MYTTINEEENIDVEIAFILDGVERYRNLTGTTLEQYKYLAVYADPRIMTFEPLTLLFTSTWPVNDRVIEIKVSIALFTFLCLW